MSLCLNEGEGCSLAHTLNGKLAIVIGACELLSHSATDPEAVARLQTIHQAAKSMVDDINKPLFP
jgi:hypothetical protein